MSKQGSKKHAALDYQFSTDKDLNEVWPEVIAEYERVTEQKLDPNTTFVSFQQNVNERLHEATSKRSSKARLVLNDVGQCLQQFGSILAGSATMVFAPSAQCWSAINFVIVAAQKYSNVLDGFVTLMERCAAFFSRLNIFLEQECGKHGSYLPRHIRRPAYDILSHFIDILKSSYKLSKSKREKFKLVLDIVLFNGDDGVKCALDLLERKVQEFTNTQIDQILVDVKGLARYLQESDEARRQHLSEIREYLEHVYEVGEETLAVTQQVKITLDGRITQEKNKEDLEKIRKTFLLKSGEEPWVKRHDQICKSRVKDSGDWIIEREDTGFFASVDTHNRQSKTKILSVEGDAGYGKTFISNRVVSYLQEKYSSNNNLERTSISYYYYGEDRENPLEKCIRGIIYQFASADPAYAGAVAEACQQSADIARAEDIWDRFVVKLQHAMKGTYYICIDGFEARDGDGNAEDTIATIAQNVLSDIKGVSIRLYFSGTNEAVARLPQDDRSVRRLLLGPIKDLGNKIVRLSPDENHESLTMIPLINASDLEAIALARVEEIGKKKPDLKTVMTEANIKKLVAGVHGHYVHLEVKLVEIDACDTEQEIQQVIDSIGDDLKTSVRRSLKVFSESLSTEQIRQLNELLVWIVGSIDTIDFLQSALYLEFRKTFMLRDLIATTFSGLLTVDEYDRVKLKSDQVLPVLREENKSHLKLSRPGLTTTELTQAEIDLCSSIVKNVCGDHVYGRFKFDDFFNSLAGKQRASVQVDDEDALNVVITRSLLQAICESKDEKHLDRLRLHASIWFYEHLRYFVEKLDYFEPDRESLTKIGSMLSHVLYDAEGIDAWLSSEYLDTIKRDLIVGDNFIEAMQKILRNPHVALGYKEDVEKTKWVQSVTAAKSNKYAVLGKIANHLAIKWFSCTTMANPEHFWIPYGIFSKEKAEKFDLEAVPSLAQIAGFLQWVQDHSKLDTTSATWSSCVGATYRILKYYKEALSAFKKAECELEDNWALLLQIAETHAGLEDFPAALEYLHKVKQLHSTLIDTDTEFKKVYWSRILLPEGNFQRHMKHYDAAKKCYRDILDQDIGSEPNPGSVHADALASLFALWIEIGDHESIMSFLRGLRHTEKGGKTLSYWLGGAVGEREDVHGHIIKAAKYSESVEEVCQMYDEVIESKVVDGASGKNSNASIPYLRYCRAALKFHGSQINQDHEEALGIWEKMVLKPGNGWDDYWVSYKARRLLARSLLDKAAANLTNLSKPTTAIDYVSRLEVLSRSTQFRQSQHDARLCLVRLHVLNDNEHLADEEARSLLRGVFDQWPEDPNDLSLRMRFGSLAQILTVFNLNDDAVAAWQALKPRHTERAGAATENGKKADISPDANEKEEVSSTADATTSTTPDLQARPDEKQSVSTDAKAEAYISYYICDACDAPWKDILADCWVCKHCLCVQLCSPCHQKLLVDELSPLVCNKDHEFLYLPKFDDALWSSVPDDIILVGGKSTPRDQWLNQFRERWEVQQEQIDTYKLETARKLKAVLCIAKYIMKWKRKRPSRRPMTRRARTFPLRPGH
ncbi:hypothetical protein N0V90_001063 [Kalmusia sp. IMI 367209]|nr:hypothetical protein N0V90_001063 [Kalmusia sp. IMI 367209]